MVSFSRLSAESFQKLNADVPSSAATSNQIVSRKRLLLRRSACDSTSRISISVWSPLPSARARRARRTASKSRPSCPPSAGLPASALRRRGGHLNAGGNHQRTVQFGCLRVFGGYGKLRSVVTQANYRGRVQFGIADLLAVYERSVRAPDIAHAVPSTVARDLQVIDRSGRTLLPGNDDVVVRGTPDSEHTILEQIPRTGERTGTQYQPRLSGRRCWGVF